VVALLLLVFVLESQAPYVIEPETVVNTKELLDWPSVPVGKSESFLVVLHKNPNKHAPIKEVLSIVVPFENEAYIVAYSYILDKKQHIFYYENSRYVERLEGEIDETVDKPEKKAFKKTTEVLI
jgi:hypothetical protein